VDCPRYIAHTVSYGRLHYLPVLLGRHPVNSPHPAELVPAAGSPLALPPLLSAQDLGELARAFTRQPHLAEHTRSAYRQDLQAWLLWCSAENVHPLQVDRADVERWVDEQAQQYAPATTARRLGTVRGWYGYLQDQRVVQGNVAARVRSPRVPNVSPTAGLSREQAQVLLAAADTAGARDAVVAGLLLLCGLRASEVGQLDVDGLQDERGHRVLVVRGKGGRVDRVPVVPWLDARLTAYLQGRTTGPLVADAGGRLDRHQVRRIVARLCRAAGLRVVSPHSLRHTTVTLALQAGAPLHRVQDLARHADPATTRRYDRAQQMLDGHAGYELAQHLVGAA
jgi:integrase/recombinase XerD